VSGILGVEGERERTFASGAEGDVDAPIVGQAHSQQIFENLLLSAGLRSVSASIRLLTSSEVMFFLKTERASLDMVRGYALFNQVALGAFHAPLGELDVVVSLLATSAWPSRISLAPVDTSNTAESRWERIQCDLLAGQHPPTVSPRWAGPLGSRCCEAPALASSCLICGGSFTSTLPEESAVPPRPSFTVHFTV